MISVFKESNIHLNAAFKDKGEAIRSAGKILVENDYVTEGYIGDMLEREEVVTTYVGNHVAIPHGVSNSQNKIKHSGISLIQVPNGVSFGEEMAYVVIGIAGKNNEHLDILSKIAHVCLEEENIEILRSAQTKREILDLFKGEI